MRVGKGEREGRAYCLQINVLQSWSEGQIYHVQRLRSAGSTKGSQWSAFAATRSGYGRLRRGIRTDSHRAVLARR